MLPQDSHSLCSTIRSLFTQLTLRVGLTVNLSLSPFFIQWETITKFKQHSAQASRAVAVSGADAGQTDVASKRGRAAPHGRHGTPATGPDCGNRPPCNRRGRTVNLRFSVWGLRLPNPEEAARKLPTQSAVRGGPAFPGPDSSRVETEAAGQLHTALPCILGAQLGIS